MRGLQTEFNFTLPLGFVDESGSLHKSGTMRLATAADEILPLRDPRAAANEAAPTAQPLRDPRAAANVAAAAAADDRSEKPVQPSLFG